VLSTRADFGVFINHPVCLRKFSLFVCYYVFRVDVMTMSIFLFLGIKLFQNVARKPPKIRRSLETARGWEGQGIILKCIMIMLCSVMWLRVCCCGNFSENDDESLGSKTTGNNLNM
jgi:hypothetical protein